MYACVMGDAFLRLCEPVRQFHSHAGKSTFSGTVEIDAPVSRLAWLLAVCVGSPLQAVNGPLKFELDAHRDMETWTRHFPFKSMTSQMVRQGDRVIETLGAARLSFSLHEREGGLEMRLERMHFWGIPCPRWLMPVIEATETGCDGALHFHVTATVPLIGMVTSYRGKLGVAAP
jgi:hypothetical protein